jgi:hypothetical protein
MSPSYFKGNLYYVTFIDNSLCKTWIYFLKTKDEVFTKFTKFKALVENQIVKKIKLLSLNNGGKSIPPQSLIILEGSMDQERVDSALQSTIE